MSFLNNKISFNDLFKQVIHSFSEGRKAAKKLGQFSVDNVETVHVKDGVLRVNGKVITTECSTLLVVKGKIGHLVTDGDVACENIEGNVRCGGDLVCKKIGGNVTCGGDMVIG